MFKSLKSINSGLPCSTIEVLNHERESTIFYLELYNYFDTNICLLIPSTTQKSSSWSNKWYLQNLKFHSENIWGNFLYGERRTGWIFFILKVFILPRVAELFIHEEKQRGCPLLGANRYTHIYISYICVYILFICLRL